MEDDREAVEKELASVNATFKEKSEDLRAQVSEGMSDAEGWTRAHVAALHQDLDDALHGLKERLSHSDHPAHEELEAKVDATREELEAEMGDVGDGEQHKAFSIVEKFHKRVDEWMEDLDSRGQEW